MASVVFEKQLANIKKGLELLHEMTQSMQELTDLSNETYTVEEESAPEGYIKSSQKVSFTIDDQHLSHQINFVNAKETIVPNTASSSSIILTILGIAILGSGIAYVYKNSKKA